MDTKTIAMRVTRFAFMHFLVDFICATLLFLLANTKHFFRGNEAAGILLTYNCAAFLLQPLAGYLMDRLKRNRSRNLFLVLSALSLTAGFAFFAIAIVSPSTLWSFYIGASFLGIGNAMFHVFGGKLVLNYSSSSIPGGAYVSAGAFGLGLGALYVTVLQVGVFAILGLVLFVTMVIAEIRVEDYDGIETVHYDTYGETKKAIAITAVIILLIAVFFRSFLGFYAHIDAKTLGISVALLAFLVGSVSFLAKLLGGILYDKAGPYVTVGVSAALGILSSFFLNQIWAALLFVFSVNLLMPVTLDVLRRYFPGKEGFSFGLAAAFLIPGYLLGATLKSYGGYDLSWVFTLISCLMLIVMFILLRRRDGGKSR